MKPLIFGDEMLISGVEWKKITFSPGSKVLSVKDFGEYFYNLGITEERRELESCAKTGGRWIIIETVRAEVRHFAQMINRKP